MLAYTILFNISDDFPDMGTEDVAAVEDQHIINEKFFLNFIQNHNKGLENFINQLKKMSEFFDLNFWIFYFDVCDSNFTWFFLDIIYIAQSVCLV